MIHLVAQGMTYGEFFFFYMLLPYIFAIVGILAAILMFVLGGSELRTIIGGKMNPRVHFVLGWSDGGKTELRSYIPFEPHIMARKNYTEFLTYSTALPGSDSGNKYAANLVTFDQARKVIPAAVSDVLVQAQVDEENAKRVAEAERANQLDSGMIPLNEAVATKTSFCGRPLWIGHISAGAAVQPELLRKLEGLKRRIKHPEAAKQFEFDYCTPETIKTWFVGNFNNGILYSILRRGIDFGKYGKPKQGFPMIILLLIFGAIGILVLGFLIISGKLDVSGFVKGLGLGV